MHRRIKGGQDFYIYKNKRNFNFSPSSLSGSRNNAGCIANLAPSSNSLRWESWLSSPISAAGSVATHTGTIGIIHPPPDIRNIVDKTARCEGSEVC
ncbi:unnamed protein product, partial [Vitis vinifera]